MSPNRRIFLNIAATYGRSLYALACGLFTARWVYLTLGKSDYGLYGVVGGLTVFIAFINNVLGVSVGRYYAYSVGRAKIEGHEAEGLEECRQWFNTAVVLHTVVPVLLMAVGYPIGEWAVRNFLTIPADRVEAFVWIFRFSCITCFWGMFSVPFNAMYAAKQYIAELTVYSFAQTTVNVLFLCYMVNHPGDWLVRYGLWNCLLAIVPAIIITARAYVVFPECRFNVDYMRSIRHLKELGKFAGLFSLELFGNLFRFNAMPILINKYFGPVMNAAYSVANNVCSHTQSFSASLRTAFQPAIVTAVGAGRKEEAIALMFRICKFGTLAVLVFAIPICIEIKEILLVWLKTPPPFAAWLTVGVIMALVLDKMTTGHFIALNALDNIPIYRIAIGACFFSTFPIAWALIVSGLGVYSIVIALNLVLLVATALRILYVARCFSVPPKLWLSRILLPIAMTTAISVIVGLGSTMCRPPSVSRVFITLAAFELVFIPLSWMLVLDNNERQFIVSRMKDFFKLFFLHNHISQTMVQRIK